MMGKTSRYNADSNLTKHILLSIFSHPSLNATFHALVNTHLQPQPCPTKQSTTPAPAPTAKARATGTCNPASSEFPTLETDATSVVNGEKKKSGLIRKYGLNMSRQAFREKATDMGWVKVCCRVMRKAGFG